MRSEIRLNDVQSVLPFMILDMCKNMRPVFWLQLGTYELIINKRTYCKTHINTFRLHSDFPIFIFLENEV